MRAAAFSSFEVFGRCRVHDLLEGAAEGGVVGEADEACDLGQLL